MERYREFAPPTVLREVVACLWENRGIHGQMQRVVPDGCVDLIWLHDELIVVGADTGPVLFEATDGLEPISGVRLRPGAAGSVLGIPASEVRDARVPATNVWSESGAVSETLGLVGPVRRLDLLARMVLQRRGARDELVAAAARRLAAPSARIAVVAAELGVSERHLHRRTVSAIGYGPKTLGRVARLRHLITLSDRSGPEPLAQRAIAAGYASQTHMSDDVRRLTGLTPVRFLEDATLTAA